MPPNRGPMDPKDIVRSGYDAISERYRADDGTSPYPYAAALAELDGLLAPGDAVLDLGCGCGVPVARELARTYEVTGVDLSAVQIERAETLVPEATFLCADMAEVDLPEDHFAGIISMYALIHVPVEEHPAILARIRRWLRPGGHVLAVVGATSLSDHVEEYLGAPMYWSHADAPTYRRWFDEAGFTRCWDRFVPEGDSGHTLILARSD